LRQVNLATPNADLAKFVFSETLSGVVAIALSLDGHLLATGIRMGRFVSGYGTATINHSGTYRLVWLSFSQDGQTLASGSDDQSIRLWDVQTGRCPENAAWSCQSGLVSEF